MFLILFIFMIVGFFIGNKYKNDNLISLIFGFILFEFLVRYLPVSYNLLSINFHDATFLYIILLVILGFVIMKFFNNNKFIIGCALFILMGFSLGFGFSFLLITYSIMCIFFGVCISSNKKILMLLMFFACCLFGCVLHGINDFRIGYLLGFCLGIVGYYIVKMFPSIIKCKKKITGLLLLIGMFLSFLVVFFK
ncbi:MAG: hypothetical protein J6D28_01920 [Bacilli bacterium]|nr:hypothetical protein [Bacilli bacterium]